MSRLQLHMEATHASALGYHPSSAAGLPLNDLRSPLYPSAALSTSLQPSFSDMPIMHPSLSRDSSIYSQSHPNVKFIYNTMETVQEQIYKQSALPKKKRFKPTPEQLAVLIESFENDPLPSAAVRSDLATTLGISNRSVQVWFQVIVSQC